MNVVLILTDQQRAGAYDTEGLRAFQAEQLPHQNALRANGINFEQHRIVSSACVPSRASIFTGRPVAEHGVFNTDGFAKQSGDAGLRWLNPSEHPTLGHRARARGLKTAYFGKWHLSPTLLPEFGECPPPKDGSRWAALTEAYQAANLLDPFGFDDWIGPEPHGHLIQNSGRLRDERFVHQAASVAPPTIALTALSSRHQLGGPA